MSGLGTIDAPRQTAAGEVPMDVAPGAPLTVKARGDVFGKLVGELTEFRFVANGYDLSRLGAHFQAQFGLDLGKVAASASLVQFGVKLGSQLTVPGNPLAPAVPYLYAQVSLTGAVSLGAHKVGGDNLVIPHAHLVIDPADPMIYVGAGGIPGPVKDVAVAVSTRGLLKFNPINRPEHLTQSVYGHAFVLGKVQVRVQGVPVVVEGSVLLDLDANNDGKLLDARRTRASDLFTQDQDGTVQASRLDSPDVSLGINGQLGIKFEYGRAPRINKSLVSITRILGKVKSGDPDSLRQLWERYFEQLVRLARGKLGQAPRRAADEEDIALSAFDSFLRGAAAGRFPRLDDRDDLWRLLVVITARKAADQVNREGRQKRGGGQVLDEGALGDDEQGLLALALSREPGPDLAAEVASECRRLLGLLHDPELRLLALLKMEGFTNEEIAHKLGWARATVQRMLKLIQQAWRREAPG